MHMRSKFFTCLVVLFGLAVLLKMPKAYAQYPDYGSGFFFVILLIVSFIIVAALLDYFNPRIDSRSSKSKSDFSLESQLYPPPQVPQQEKLFCRYCGVENEGDAVFCMKCGKKIS